MKTFYLLSLKHKIFKDLEDIFTFDDLDLFCHFSEKFHLNDDWDVSYNTNTQDLKEYIEVLNTDTSRQFIDIEPDYFDDINDVNNYYLKNLDSFKVSVKDFLLNLEPEKDEFSELEDFSSSNFYEDYHVLVFYEGSVKKFTSLDSLIFFVDKMKKNNIDDSFYRIQINPELVSFEDYIQTMKRFDKELKLPEEVNNKERLNNFLVSLEDLSEVDEIIEARLNNKKRKA